jgi:dimethylglycine dehydrogenase
VAGRARLSPLYDKLKAKGAVHTEVYGWERPKWFSPDGRQEDCGFRRNNVFEVVAEECKAVRERVGVMDRERVGVMDVPSFAKYEVTGPDAEAFLNRVCANRVARRHGGIVLAHMLTGDGRMQNEFTLTRLADDHFYVLSGAASELRDFDLLNHAKLNTEEVTITNVTEAFSILVVAGPRSRDLLSKITDTDLSNNRYRPE